MTRVSSEQFRTFLAMANTKVGHTIPKAAPEEKKRLLVLEIAMLKDTMGEIKTKQLEYTKGFRGTLRSRFRSLTSKDAAPLAQSKMIMSKIERQIKNLEDELVPVQDLIIFRKDIESKRRDTSKEMTMIQAEIKRIEQQETQLKGEGENLTQVLDTQTAVVKDTEKSRMPHRKKTKQKNEETKKGLEQGKFVIGEVGREKLKELQDLATQKRALNAQFEADRKFLGILEEEEKRIPAKM